MLRQVLETLARNGTARASQVNLTAQSVGKHVIIEIADNGLGFGENVLPFVFDRFRRGDSLGSSGLGLAIAKKVIEAHGRTITASNGENGGAVVAITLPLSPDPR